MSWTSNFLGAILVLQLRQMDSKTLKIGALIPWTGSWPAGPRMASAILVAKDHIESHNLIPDYNLTYVWQDDMCSAGPSLRGISDLWVEKPSVDVYIGPACSVGCVPGAFLAAHWNIPMISYGCGDAELSNKRQYPTFTRTVGPYTQSGKFFAKIMEEYNWHRLAILASTEQVWSQIASFVKEDMDASRASGKKIQVSYFQTFNQNLTTDSSFKNMLRSARSRAHIFLICGYGSSVRKILLNAYDLDMVSSSYVFFSIEMLASSCKGDDGRDADACRAFEGLLDIGQHIPSTQQYRQFQDKVRQRMPEFAGLGHHMAATDEVDVFGSFLYDAVLLYALAVNATISSGRNATDGRFVTQNIVGRDFMGSSGHVSINQNGDRDLSLQLRNIQGNTFVRVANYFTNGNRYERLNRTIVWPGGLTTAPLGRPQCGFDNELCPPEEIWKYIAYPLVAFIVLLVVVLLFIIYRRKKEFETALKSQQWRVKCDNVKFIRKILGSRRSLRTATSAVSTAEMSVFSGNFEDMKGQVFTTVGVYNSLVVAVKKLRKTSVTLNRNVLLELKEMWELNHVNVNRFVGACVDSPNIWILMQYCPKGSLQDVLNDDNLKLDSMFEISFASDIARGMNFIHKCPIRCHGDLRSSNCVIDSRWVCKITDHGLNSLKEGETVDLEVGLDQKYNQLLWRAPEHLDEFAESTRSQAGDVFSYGIILQEIILRGLPYCMDDFMEAKTIVNRVRKVESPPFRPKIPGDTGNPLYVSLMTSCWVEQPLDRPKFSEILNVLKKINGGKQINIMDNMISMMEKYTDHLEDIVHQRTQQLEEEKLKTDALLYRMLPQTVAEQLKRGQQVKAESFNQVTIFFSDIVAFTELASESSPFQVVALLNDLYTCFDTIIDSHEVYKVETIGDSYMVVSGLPTRNGAKHAGEIANMSLDLLSDMGSFTIRHMPGRQLQLRIGIHSGPCVAGVVGLKMPRYCLFGDTVNTASRMESSGLALRIHVSQTCKTILDQLTGYQLEERGLVTIKGKGEMLTYFLTGREGFNKPLPDLKRASSLAEHTFK